MKPECSVKYKLNSTDVLLFKEGCRSVIITVRRGEKGHFPLEVGTKN